jgi:hypothetical protein
MGESINEEKGFLRWGGLAGILAGVFFMVTIVTLVEFGPSTTATAAQLAQRFPSVSTGLAVGNAFYFLVSVSLLGLALGLYRSLRGKSPALALFGTVLFVLGIGVTFVEDTTQFAFAPLSNLYNAPGATPVNQATVALLWQATQGMFNQFDTSATILLSTGLIVFGIAMFKARTFGKIFGGLSAAFGVAQILGITFVSTNSAAYAPFAILAFFVFPVVFGLKLFRISRAVMPIEVAASLPPMRVPAITNSKE